MVKNNYVTTREFESTVQRIEKQIDSNEIKIDVINNSVIKVAIEVGELKKHFNDEMKTTVKTQMNKESYKMDLKKGIFIAGLSGLISFIVAVVVK